MLTNTHIDRYETHSTTVENMDQSTENIGHTKSKISRLVKKALHGTMSRRSFSDKKTKRKGSIMKTAILILLTTLITGCMTPQQMSTYKPIKLNFDSNVSTDTSVRSTTGTHSVIINTINSVPSYPRAQTIVTTQGNYVVIPNYSSGGVQAIITPGR